MSMYSPGCIPPVFPGCIPPNLRPEFGLSRENALAEMAATLQAFADDLANQSQPMPRTVKPVGLVRGLDVEEIQFIAGRAGSE